MRLIAWLGHERYRGARHQIAGGMLAITALINLFYFTNVFPPLPLVLSDAGIYHNVKRVGAGYQVQSEEGEPAGWRTLLGVYPTLHMAPGEKLYLYSAVFAPYRLTTAIEQRLEAESIHIMREVAAEFRNPVMLYSIGKDSSVMLHLAMKAFYPSQAAVSAAARRYDLEIQGDDRVSRRDREAAGPRADRPHQRGRGSPRHQSVRFRLGAPHPGDEDRGLKQALDKYGFDAAFGGARRDEEKAGPRSASSRSAPRPMRGIRRTSAPNSGASTTRASGPANPFACFRCRTGPSSMSGNT
jgi:hypothetical protein